MENNSEDLVNTIEDMLYKLKTCFNISSINKTFWANMEREWNSSLQTKWNQGGRRTFNYFHDINTIQTTIPDTYLKKYREVFID